MFNEWVGSWFFNLPLVWGEELPGVFDSLVGGDEEVSGSLGVTNARGVDILETGHGEKLLGDRTGDDTRTAWSWDETHTDGTALTGDGSWGSVWITDLVTPVATANWDDGKLSVDGGALDSISNFSGSLDTETNVAILVTDSDDSLKAGALTGTSLLLDWLDLHDFVLELITKELINDLWFLDWDGVEEDFFDGLDLAIEDEATELGHWNPSFLALAGLTATAWGAFIATTTSAHTATALFAFGLLNWCFRRHTN